MRPNWIDTGRLDGKGRPIRVLDPAVKFHTGYEVNEETGCWIWQRSLNNKGYGLCTALGERFAHRVSVLLHGGELAADRFVCHRCDNPPCVNPAHLFLGTAKDNAADMVRKNRQARLLNEQSGMAKVSDQDVQVMRDLRDAGWSINAIAEGYPISASHVSRICARKSRPSGVSHLEGVA